MDKRYWDEELETANPETLDRLEGSLLQEQAEYVYARSRYYSEKFDSAGVKPQDLRGREGLARLPFTEKAELSQSQAGGDLFGANLCVTHAETVRIVGTGGTTGQPLRLGYTRDDLETYSEQGARALWAMGCRPADIVFNCFNYSLYAGGIADHGAFEKMGANIIPYSVGNSQRLLEMMAHLQDDLSLYATPSYAIRLAERAAEDGLDLPSLGVRKGLFSGEAGLQVPGYRERIESLWQMKARDLYGTSEVGAQSAECEYMTGLHFFGAGLVIAELINPETGAVLPFEEGATGELVFTTLKYEACPLIRLRSHDFVQVFTEPCPCGRTGFRFLVLGRSDDMFIVKGVNVFPLGVQEVLLSLRPRLTGEFYIVLEKAPPIDYAPVLRVEVAHVVPEETQTALRAEVQALVRDKLGFTAEVELVPQGRIASAHKTRRLYRVYAGVVPE
jgi:phenylacetate-CoA ligase